jgi:hypothetical protein
VSNELNYQTIESTDPWAGTAVSQGAGTVVGARAATGLS